jgi:hypothetical protein
VNESQKQTGIPLIDKFRTAIDAMVGTSEFVIQKNQGSFEDYINRRTAELDESILAYERQYGFLYAGGVVQLALVGNDEFIFEASFYFQDAQKQWKTKVMKSQAINIRWAFTPEYQQKLRDLKQWKFDYVRPTSC